MNGVTLRQGDARDLSFLPDKSVQCCVTSPPYWGLRDYGLATWEGGDEGCEHEGDGRYYTERTAVGASSEAFSEAGAANAERLKKSRWREAGTCTKCGAVRHDAGIGLERTPEEFVANIVAVFREVRRVLRDDGTLWLNLGDCFGSGTRKTDKRQSVAGNDRDYPTENRGRQGYSKQLVGIPWRVAFALQADGWYLRSDIIWAKPNPMPESVTDRPTKAHEYLFLLTKRAKYYYDAEAVREPISPATVERNGYPYTGTLRGRVPSEKRGPRHWEAGKSGLINPAGRNRRDVWFVPTQPYKGAHFATFPEKLVEPCILAGSSPKACGVCGAPWERVVKRGELVSVDGTKADYRPTKATDDARIKGRSDGWTPNHVRETETVGWRPACDCDIDDFSHDGGHFTRPADTVPCIVLDPFCGSGTTGAVSVRLGRNFVGVDLSAEYLEMARERIEAQPPPLPGLELNI